MPVRRGPGQRSLLDGMPGVRSGVVITTGTGLAAAGLTVVQMLLLSRIIKRVLLVHQGMHAIVPLLAAIVAVLLARAVLIFVRELVANRTALRLKATVRARLLRHLLRLGPAYLQGERTGELLATATEGIERLEVYVGRYLPQRLLSVGIPLLIVAVILPYDWVSAALLVATAPIILMLMMLIGSYGQDRMQQQWETLGRLSACFLDVIQGLPTLLLFNQAGIGRQRVANVSEQFRVRTLGVLRVATISGATLELMSSVAIGLVAATLGVRLLDGGISFDRAFLVFLLAPEFYRPLRELGVQRHAAMEGEAAARRITEIMQIPVPVDTPAVLSPSTIGIASVELVDLSYTYPEGTWPAVERVTLRLEAGTCTALMGRSGAGKTTLINLLLRFIDPTAGGILVNGVPLALLSVDRWRAQVALVPQRPYLFRGTIQDNIRLARPQAADHEVVRAARLAGVDRVVAELPDRYDTRVGERGAGLSAGQVQRIAIARAFLKDAPVLILDEPTSALDPESEVLIREALRCLTSDRTVLVVAHRINTVLAADQIAVLAQGRLVDVGRHESLLQRSGLYAALVQGTVREEVTA